MTCHGAHDHTPPTPASTAKRSTAIPRNAGIAGEIFVSEGTVENHVRSILTKLDLPESETGHRRVLAVLRFLDAR